MNRKHLKNVAGIALGFAVLIFGTVFSLWQLDLIVSGPVWWEESPTGRGWCWNGPGAYQRLPFQCTELWKTTIGRAYDTLFFVNFIMPIIGTIIIFVSLWYWEEESIIITEQGNLS